LAVGISAAAYFSGKGIGGNLFGAKDKQEPSTQETKREDPVPEQAGMIMFTMPTTR
jgi:hypothetical protein